MTEHDARALPAALVALVTCTVVAGNGRWILAIVVLGVTCVGGFLGVRLAQRSRRVRDTCRIVATASLLACVIAGIGAMRDATALPSEVRFAMVAGEPVTIRGVVVSDPRALGADAWTGAERSVVRVAVDRACREPCTVAHRAHATVDVVTEVAVPPMGAEIVATGAARASGDPRVHVTLWSAELERTGREDGVLSTIGTARERTRSQAQGLDPQVRDLTTGMVLGDTSAMPPDLTEAMRVTSLTHLTAVSGSHFAIVTLALGILLRTTVRRLWLRALILALAMVTLTVFVGPDPSVQRALTMALAVATGVWWGRPSHALPALGVGILVLLAIEPTIGASIGLHLSALAVVAIVVWAPRLRDLLARWLLRSVATALAVPLAAWLACWPLLITLNPGLGPYAVPANLIAGLAAFPVTLIGLTGAVVGQLWPVAGVVTLHIASWCAWPVVWAARSFSAAPGAWVAWPSGVAGSGLACLVSGLIAWGTMTRQVRVAWRAGAAIAGVVVTLASPVLATHAATGVRDAAIVVCDVGQGDMALVMVDDGAAVVIDTGPPGGAGAACLQRYHVDAIPLLILTHPHADHDGAVSEVLNVASVEQVWVSPVTSHPAHAGAARIALSHGVPVSVPHPGQEAEYGAARVVVMAPQAGVERDTAEDALNDASIVVWASSGSASALLLGDMETEAQDALARQLDAGIVVDLVKVAHHGSRIQSTRLAQAITARIAAVSVGEHNSYGHPHPDALALYEARATHVLTTSACGDIVVTSAQKVAARCLPSMAG